MVDSSNANEFLAAAAFFVGTIISTIIAYFMKKPPQIQQDAVVAGVGLELGNRMQMTELIEQQKRCADYLSIISSHLAVLADRKQAAVEEHLDEIHELLEKMADKERRAG